MRALTGELLLAAVEEGAHEHDLDRALTLLALALPSSERADLAELAIVERNLLLLRLRELSFGPLLAMIGSCPRCEARLEFTLPVGSIGATIERLAPAGAMEWSDGHIGRRLRPLNTNDLLAVADEPDYRAAQERLLMRCFDEVGVSGARVSPPEAAEIRQRFEDLHAAAEVRCAIECVACSERATLDIDVSRILWLEVRGAARRLLSDIHELARAYGWSEPTILSMSSRRRNAYLEMIGA